MEYSQELYDNLCRVVAYHEEGDIIWAEIRVAEIKCLLVEIDRLKEEGKKDYDGMREFQAKYIKADHALREVLERLHSYGIS